MWEGGTEREEAMKRAKKECVCCVYVLYSLAEGSCCYLACLPACLVLSCCCCCRRRCCCCYSRGRRGGCGVKQREYLAAAEKERERDWLTLEKQPGRCCLLWAVRRFVPQQARRGAKRGKVGVHAARAKHAQLPRGRGGRNDDANEERGWRKARAALPAAPPPSRALYRAALGNKLADTPLPPPKPPPPPPLLGPATAAPGAVPAGGAICAARLATRA